MTPSSLLMKSVYTPLAKSVLVPLGLTAAASAIDANIQKNCGLDATTLVFSNEDLNNIMKIVKPLEEPGLLIKRIIETVKNEAKERKGDFFGILLATLGDSLLGNMLAGKGVVRGVDGVISASEKVIRAGEGHDF